MADGAVYSPVCEGYAEMEGERRGGMLRRLFACLGPQAEYGACPGTETEADP
ncbi:MAG: hypothetical protein LBG57_05515 [Treponema sp.]|nr:hypothetical protein [Treponema sp.]